MSIEWKKIEMAPDYWISNRGEVLSRRTSNEKLLTSFHNKKTGYCHVSLSINPKPSPGKRTYQIHQLVAQAFVDNPHGYDRVHHLDHDKTNNHYWNLCWVSQEQNIHAYYNSDEKNKPRNMKPIEVWDTKGNYINSFPSINKAAKETGVSPSTVWKIVKGKIKEPRKYIFKYEE